jgi:hypothetical protein
MSDAAWMAEFYARNGLTAEDVARIEQKYGLSEPAQDEARLAADIKAHGLAMTPSELAALERCGVTAAEAARLEAKYNLRAAQVSA